MADKSPVSRQSSAIPTGGGDVRGLGESFQPDLNSGVGSYRIALDLLPGVRSFQPALALGYGTGAGNGPWGLGWSLPLAAIQRRTFRGVPSYTDDDAFLFAGQAELLPVAPQTWRAAVENGFERFTRAAEGWQVTERSGVRHTFGRTAASRIEFTEDGETKTFAWLIDRSEDTCGNAITYHYRPEGAQRYLEEVRYAVYAVRFEYEPRPDAFSEFRSGFELRTDLRCSRIALHLAAEPAAIRTWDLDYREASLSALSLLRSVTLTGHDPETGASAALPPIEFSYSEFAPENRRLRKVASELGAGPPGLDQPNLELIDLEGRGLPGLLAIENGRPRYWPNRGQLRWGPPRSLPRFPASFSIADERVQLADMDGNGGADVLVGSGGTLSGYFGNEGTGAFEPFNSYARRPELDFATGGLLLMDVDGDGRTDAVRTGRTGLQVFGNRGPEGWDPPRLVPRGDPALAPPDLSSGDPRVRLADMNGDGLPDIVLLSAGRFEYWPSRGGGRFAAPRTLAAPPRFPFPFDPARVFLTDLNGDGLADVVYAGYDEVTYWINQSGGRFSPPQTIRYTPPTPNPETMRVADMTGAGTAGLLWTSPYPDHRYLDFTGGVKPGLLTRIDNHLGRVLTIEYGTSTQQALADEATGQPWSSFLPFPVQVVARVSAEDSVSGQRGVTRYRYHEGHYDGHRREFDGFARAEQIEEGDASMPSALTVFHFHTEASARALVADPELRRTLKRKLYRVEVFGQDGSPLEDRPYRVEESQWAVRVERTAPDGRRVLFPHVEETRVHAFERGTAARVERRRYTYDLFGSVVAEECRGEGGSGADLFLRTTVEYAVNTADWVVDRIARIVQRDEAGRLLQETRHYYDGPDFLGLPLGQVTKGLLSRTERVALPQAEAAAIYGAMIDFPALGYHAGNDVDGRATWNLNHERFRVDAQGNVVAKQDARGHITAYGFDAFGLFATRITDAKGLTGLVEPDYRAGKSRRLVNPNGGVTEARYDPLARVAKVAFPGDTLALPTVAYTYDTGGLPAVRATEYRILAGDGRAARIFEYLDGNGAVFQRRTEHDGDTFAVSGHNLINARGKLAEKLQPFFAGGGGFQPYVDDPAAARQHLFYDALGRPTATSNADGGQSRAVYEAFQTLLFDPEDVGSAGGVPPGRPRAEQYDAWQRLVAVEDRGPAATHTTRYRLDPLGNLLRITDARGVVLSESTYDLLGRRIAIRHADAGRHLIAYDAAGNVALNVDGAGQIIARSFDEMNRVVTVTHGGGTGAMAEQYFYDSGSGANLKGNLARVIDSSGETAFGYDARGNVVERSTTVAGEPAPFTFQYEYDRLGRGSRLTYPDGVAVDFEYYSGLLLRGIPGYVDRIEYTAAGMRSALDYANGVRTEYRYDAETLRLAGIRTGRPAGGEIYFDSAYTIGKAGDVEGIADLRAGAAFSRTQEFGYDLRHRLTHASGTDVSGAYTHDYRYDAAGNFLENPQIAPHPLVYESGTNRLTGFESSAGPVSLFEYDANGNMTALPGRTLSFTAKQELASVALSDGTEVHFSYDFRGSLAARRLTGPAGGGTTLFFDNLFETQAGAAVRWVFAGELPVARESGGAKVFLHNDHLGSAVVYTGAAGELLTETAYYPFGGLALPPSANALASFTTKHRDADIGLYYFNARWYAPDLGRFITPDPLYLFHPEQGLQEPQRLNPYSYAENNPLRFVDPTGLGTLEVLGTILVVVAIVVALVAVAVLTAGVGAAIGYGTLALYAGGAGLAGAVLGGIVGGIAYGSWEGALRGAMIGFTAGVNAMIGYLALPWYVGAAMGLVTFLSVIPPIAKSDVYQGILGWTSYVMPMSWPGHAIGLALFVANLFTAGRIHDMTVDWKTGAVVTLGGWVSRLTPGGLQGHTIGGFVWFDPRATGNTIPSGTLEHEAGHHLNNAAFGWLQVVNVFSGTGRDNYFERLAESNAPSSRGKPRLDQWG